MSLFDIAFPTGKRWLQVGDTYEVTKKPRGLDISSLPSIPFATMESIPQGGPYAPCYTFRAPGEIRSGTYFERDNVLVAKITPSFENGKQALTTALPTPFGFATTEIIPLRQRREGHDNRLLFFYLLHPDVRHYVSERMEGTTGRQRIPEDVLLKLPFPEFESVEQTTMANSLEMIQSSIAVEARTIDVTIDLKRTAMQKLFTCGLRGEERRETEIGPVPENWKVIALGSVRDRLQYGTSLKCSYESSKYPVIRIPNIEPQKINLHDLKYCELSDEKAARFRLEDGDLLFIRTNGVLDRLGSCAIYSGEPANALFASYLIRARLKRDLIMPSFAAYFFSSDIGSGIIAGRATPASDGKYNLNTAAIEGLPIPTPPLDEQKEIVDVLNAIDRKIDLHRRKREVLDDLFKALLHKLITREVRADDINLPGSYVVE